MRPSEWSAEAAKAMAIDALAFLASDMERLGRFLALTGLSPATIRQAAATDGFALAVLDHLSTDESLLLAFAANAGLDPGGVLKARDALAGPHPQGLREG